MNEDRLENLLKEKKDQVFHFNRSEEEFFAGFIAETKCHEAQKIHIWRYAAIFAAVLGLAVLAVISMRNYPLPASETTKPVSMATNKAPARSFDPMQESLRLFGDDVAVLFVGNDLVIGERMNREMPSNVLNVKLADNLELKIACADNDSISINAPGVFGNIIVSRSDRQTLVLDVDLLILGKRIHTQIPVDSKIQKNQSGRILS